MVFVRVRDNPPLVDVFSPVLTEVEPTEQLYVKLAELTHRMPIGRLYCTNDTVWASIPVFGRDFQATHLMLAVQVMTGLADELDDRLHGEFGGKRFFGEGDKPPNRADAPHRRAPHRHVPLEHRIQANGSAHRRPGVCVGGRQARRRDQAVRTGVRSMPSGERRIVHSVVDDQRPGRTCAGDRAGCCTRPTSVMPSWPATRSTSAPASCPRLPTHRCWAR